MRNRFVPLFDLSMFEQMLGGFVGKLVFWNCSNMLLYFLSPSVGVRLILDEKRDLGPAAPPGFSNSVLMLVKLLYRLAFENDRLLYYRKLLSFLTLGSNSFFLTSVGYRTERN